MADQSQFRARYERQYHIGCGPGDVGRYVMMPGDPARVPKLAALLDDAREVAHRREFLTWTGTLDGEQVTVTSTGVGSPSTAIAVDELAWLGADTFVRVGTAGLLQPATMSSGDLVVASGAVRDEGTSSQYVPLAFPAVAHVDVVMGLRQACVKTGTVHHVGICHSKDAFYGELEPERLPRAEALAAEMQTWVRAGVLCSEMEASALFVTAAVAGLRAGCLLMAANREERTDTLCRVAVEGIRCLIANDRESEAEK